MLTAAGDFVLGKPGLRTAEYLATKWLRDEESAGAPSVSVALGVAADEAFRTLMAALSGASAGSPLNDLVDETIRASELFEAAGWLSEPTAYHLEPPPLRSPTVVMARHWGREYQHLRFVSEYEPRAGEPGRDRWLGYRPVREAHAWLLRHRGRSRPWIVCVHGYRMGFPTADFHAFRVNWLHHELGLNVLMPVLPLHGPRKVGRRSGDGMFSPAIMDTVHAEAQAVWDIRRLLGWASGQGAGSAGLYGISLGGYTVALLAGLVRDASCAVAAMPITCFHEIFAEHAPRRVLDRVQRLGLEAEHVVRALRVVSPLASKPRIPTDALRIIVAASDRLIPQGQIEALWRHWGEPALYRFDGSHLSFSWQSTVINELVGKALRECGLVYHPVGGSKAA